MPLDVKKRGRPASISKDAVLEAAFKIGFRDVTMHAISRELGVSVSALYRHVASKEDVLFQCADEVSKRVELPETEDWKEYIRSLARSYRKVVLSLPGSVEFVRVIGLATPAACAVINQSLSVLKHAGFEGKIAYIICIGLISHAIDLALQEEQSNEGAKPNGGIAPATKLAGLADEYPEIAWALAESGAVDQDEYFETGLDVYISGLENVTRR